MLNYESREWIIIAKGSLKKNNNTDGIGGNGDWDHRLCAGMIKITGSLDAGLGTGGGVGYNVLTTI